MTSRHTSPEEIERDLDATRQEIGRTLEALQEKISVGQLVDRALGAMRGGGAGFAGNVGRTVRDNPVPLALLGVGLTWLMMSDRASRRGHASGFEGGTPASFGGAPASAGAGSAGTATAAGGPRPIEATSTYGSGERTESRRGAVTGRAGEAAGRAGEAAGRVKAKAAEWTGAAGERLSAMRSGAGERASHVRGTAAERFRGARERTATYAQSAREAGGRAGNYMVDHPLLVGTLGLAVGAAIAAALPPTRREDRTMGQASDDMKQAAGDTLRQSAKKAKDVADTAVGAAEKEAERQGLTPEAGREEAGRMAQSGTEVAKAATRAVEDEVRRPGAQGGAGAKEGGGPSADRESGEGRKPGPAGPAQQPRGPQSR